MRGLATPYSSPWEEAMTRKRTRGHGGDPCRSHRPGRHRGARAVGGESVKPKPPAAPPAAPAPGIPAPVPPIPPHPGGHGTTPSTAVKRYYLAPGETHKGDLYFMSESVEIAGKQQGDLSVFARESTLPGTVTGDINAWSSRPTSRHHGGRGARLLPGPQGHRPHRRRPDRHVRHRPRRSRRPHHRRSRGQGRERGDPRHRWTATSTPPEAR